MGEGGEFTTEQLREQNRDLIRRIRLQIGHVRDTAKMAYSFHPGIFVIQHGPLHIYLTFLDDLDDVMQGVLDRVNAASITEEQLMGVQHYLNLTKNTLVSH